MFYTGKGEYFGNFVNGKETERACLLITIKISTQGIGKMEKNTDKGHMSIMIHKVDIMENFMKVI